jgi:hypothetical protein
VIDTATYASALVGQITLRGNRFIDCATPTIRLQRCREIILAANTFEPATASPQLEVGRYTEAINRSAQVFASVSHDGP